MQHKQDVAVHWCRQEAAAFGACAAMSSKASIDRMTGEHGSPVLSAWLNPRRLKHALMCRNPAVRAGEERCAHCSRRAAAGGRQLDLDSCMPCAVLCLTQVYTGAEAGGSGRLDPPSSGEACVHHSCCKTSHLCTMSTPVTDGCSHPEAVNVRDASTAPRLPCQHAAMLTGCLGAGSVSRTGAAMPAAAGAGVLGHALLHSPAAGLGP